MVSKPCARFCTDLKVESALSGRVCMGPCGEAEPTCFKRASRSRIGKRGGNQRRLKAISVSSDQILNSGPTQLVCLPKLSSRNTAFVEPCLESHPTVLMFGSRWLCPSVGGDPLSRRLRRSKVCLISCGPHGQSASLLMAGVAIPETRNQRLMPLLSVQWCRIRRGGVI